MNYCHENYIDSLSVALCRFCEKEIWWFLKRVSNFIVAVCAPRRVQNRDSSVALSIMADLILLVPVQHLLASPVMLPERERESDQYRASKSGQEGRSRAAENQK